MLWQGILIDEQSTTGNRRGRDWGSEESLTFFFLKKKNGNGGWERAESEESLTFLLLFFG